MKKLLLFSMLSIIIMSFGCKPSDDDDMNPTCDQEVIVNSELYDTAPNDPVSIHELEIEGDCLKIEFSASGCDGESWDVKLIDSEAILESFPVQRNLRLSVNNNEECDAVITKEYSFDITELQLDYDKILLNLTNSDHQILYEY